MKTKQRFAISAMAAAVLLTLGACGQMSTRDGNSVMGTAPVVAQNTLPQCTNSNYDQARGIFTVINAAPDAVNQQCLITVYPAQASASGAQNPAPYLVEGRYDILLSGGGGGGTGGEYWNRGGGYGGAGSAPIRTSQYLAPGVYKLTIGTGGKGGEPGGQTYGGNLTSVTNADSGQLIAGYRGADVAKQIVRDPEMEGRAGDARAFGGSKGGDGGDTGAKNSESAAQGGGESQTRGYSGHGGSAGTERTDRGNRVQANAGGGGGAGVGAGGSGESRDGMNAGGMGELGGGGGGGRGGFFTADPGGAGGHGFIKLTLNEAVIPRAAVRAPAVVVVEPAPVVAAAAPERASASEAASAAVTTPAPTAYRPARMDRN